MRYLLFSLVVSFLMACTTDVGYAPDGYSDSSPSFNAKGRGNLPDCNSDREGLVVHVNGYNDYGTDYACSKGYWVALRNSETDKTLHDVNENTDVVKDLHEKFKTVESASILDVRDDKVYNVVVFSGLVWMAENLDYETEYSRTNPQCDEYGIRCGRYYRWDDAAYGDGGYSSVCPSGMRLPTEEDVEKLVDFIGGIQNGYVLKSKDYWDYSDEAPQGTDEIGFNVYPAGYKRSSRNYFEFFGTKAAFWTEISNGYRSSRVLSLYNYTSNLETNWGVDWDEFMNVRCVGDL